MDLLAWHHTLSFVNYRDWPVMKPYLINKQFHSTIFSEHFAKEFLTNIFRLTPKEVDHLVRVGLKFADNFHDDGVVPAKKKRKHEELPASNYFDNIPKTLSEIMIMYIRISLERGIEKIRKQFAESVEALRDSLNEVGDTRVPNDLYKQIKFDHAFACRFNNFFIAERLTCLKRFNKKISLNSFKFEASVIKHLMGENIKDLFILRGRSNSSVMRILIFTSFGFPLLIESRWVHNEEMILVYKKKVIHHQLKDPTIIAKYDHSILSHLESLLFVENADNYFLQKGVTERVESLKKLMIYMFLSNSLGYFSETFFLDGALSWIPFFGDRTKDTVLTEEIQDEGYDSPISDTETEEDMDSDDSDDFF